MKLQFDYIKSPLNKFTFFNKPIREWIEVNSYGYVLNLFAGRTLLNLMEVRNDIDVTMPAQYHEDALKFVKSWKGKKFDTIILDPPYALRKSMEMYKGNICSPFKQLKDEISRILKKKGTVITFGYQSVNMGKKRNFELEKIAIFSHGGAIHDTIASIERKIK